MDKDPFFQESVFLKNGSPSLLKNRKNIKFISSFIHKSRLKSPKPPTFQMLYNNDYLLLRYKFDSRGKMSNFYTYTHSNQQGKKHRIEGVKVVVRYS